MHVDHIIPASKGGTNDTDNLQPLCPGCNAIKGNKLLTNEELRERNKSLERFQKITESRDLGIFYLTDKDMLNYLFHGKMLYREQIVAAMVKSIDKLDLPKFFRVSHIIEGLGYEPRKHNNSNRKIKVIKDALKELGIKPHRKRGNSTIYIDSRI